MTDDYISFMEDIFAKTGIDLSLYKETQMKRRLTSLRDKRGYRSFSSYFQAMEGDRELLEELMNKVTINVSEFYRNRQRFDVLEKKVIPHLLKKNKRLRVWSAACSTGEEPYTLAMILSRFFPREQLEIIATDIDPQALARAKEGVYHERSLKEVPDKIKQAHFTKEGSFYRVHEDIRSRVVFKEHNLLADAFPSRCDLIVCRNVMIYFTEEAKKELYFKFNQALEADGIFFVGSTEQIFSPEHYHFKVFDTFFYQKVNRTSAALDVKAFS
ncbi:protein-glutamate O-methyltransferase CheR [Halobacillus kuroshimensis]|uniref:protein-glutamate O-methyltransferase n=1 Tax=Halobacillus kuroshimensis TaxID=302481 RepID=A0ABS3DTJ9_9BACI|nr:protein-glutamate O-methyltransferase CheR [Halobacillus kuroshimensis]MBN8234679.1 protein-glutamate O-methyltransferase CheR [Halobacillus kuroshimensis]